MNLTPTEQQILVSSFILVGTGLLTLVIYLAKGVLKEQKGISNHLSKMAITSAIVDKDIESVKEDVAEVKGKIVDHEKRIGSLEYKWRSIQ